MISFIILFDREKKKRQTSMLSYEFSLESYRYQYRSPTINWTSISYVTTWSFHLTANVMCHSNWSSLSFIDVNIDWTLKFDEIVRLFYTNMYICMKYVTELPISTLDIDSWLLLKIDQCFLLKIIDRSLISMSHICSVNKI
jgi:hypothetical protein